MYGYTITNLDVRHDNLLGNALLNGSSDGILNEYGICLTSFVSRYLVISGKEACPQLMQHDPKKRLPISNLLPDPPAGRQCSKINAGEMVRPQRRRGKREPGEWVPPWEREDGFDEDIRGCPVCLPSSLNRLNLAAGGHGALGVVLAALTLAGLHRVST